MPWTRRGKRGKWLSVITILIALTATASCTHTAPQLNAIKDAVCGSFERIEPVTFSSSQDSPQTVTEIKRANQGIVDHNAVLDFYECPEV